MASKIQPCLTNPLVHNKLAIGTRAHEIYDKGCKLFGWDTTKLQIYAVKDMFSNMIVDGKEIGVWFIGYNNFSQQHEKFTNEIDVRDNWKITETFLDKSRPIESTCPERVIFAKDHLGHYIFLGVYDRTNVDYVNKISEYTRREKQYPY